jgi:signal transduction histidine kinase
MAEVYEKLLQPQKAIDYNRKAIVTAEKSGDKASIARRYLDFIVRMVNAKRFDTVEVLLNKIEPLVKEIDESFSSFYFNQNKGYLFQHQQNYTRAIEYYKKAKASAVISNDQYQYLTILDPLAQSLMKAGLMEEAKLTLDTLLDKSKEYKMNFGLLYAYTNLAEWYSLKADYKTANEFLYKKMLLSDSIASDEIQEKIMKTETRYRVQAKDNEIKLLQTEKINQQLALRQKNTFNFILIAGGLALLIISLLLYRNYRHKQNLQQQRIAELETQQQLSATEAVLQGEEQERTRLAKDLHDGLGGMLSSVKYSFSNMKGNLIMTPENAQAFERSIDMLDSSIQEMRRVAHNMMPEALVKFGLDTALKDFCNEIERSGAIAVQYQSIGLENSVLPPIKAIGIYRIVQELMNNILKHSAAKNAMIQLSKREDQVSITVEDDGKGFDKNMLKKTKGMGWSNIENRVEFFKGSYDVNSQIGKGTSVLIEINL